MNDHAAPPVLQPAESTKRGWLATALAFMLTVVVVASVFLIAIAEFDYAGRKGEWFWEYTEGKRLHQQGQYASAAPLLEHALFRSPTRGWHAGHHRAICRALADCYVYSASPEVDAKAYEQAQKCAGKKAMTYYDAARGHVASGEYGAATKDLAKALRLQATLAWSMEADPSLRALQPQKQAPLDE